MGWILFALFCEPCSFWQLERQQVIWMTSLFNFYVDFRYKSIRSCEKSTLFVISQKISFSNLLKRSRFWSLSRSLNGNLLARNSLKCTYVNYKHKTLDTVFKSISVGHLNFRHNIIPLSIVPWLRANPVEHRAEMNTARTVVSNIWYSSPPNWRPVCSDTLVQQITGNYNTTHINQFSSSFI